jgi:hypothetical protein
MERKLLRTIEENAEQLARPGGVAATKQREAMVVTTPCRLYAVRRARFICAGPKLFNLSPSRRKRVR